MGFKKVSARRAVVRQVRATRAFLPFIGPLLVAAMVTVSCGDDEANGDDAASPDAGRLDGSTVDAPPAACGTAQATQVSVGAQFSCARMSDSTARCWGANFQAQLGDGENAHQWWDGAKWRSGCFTSESDPERPDCSPRPVIVANSLATTDIDAGHLDHACLRREDGTLACWGMNSYGQVGATPPSREYEPVEVPVASATEIALGDEFSCARTEEGLVFCWGANEWGQLGKGSADEGGPVPVQVAPLGAVVTIAVGQGYACAVLTDGGAACWGLNNLGQIGDGTVGENRSAPTPVSDLSGVRNLALGFEHTCALIDDGSVWCWGGNAFGQLGDGTTEDRAVPTLVSSVTNATAIYAAGRSTCARTAEGVWCWGLNSTGQLATETAAQPVLVPTRVPALDATEQLDIGFEHGCGVFPGGEVRCWGRGDFGALGNGSEAWSTQPVPVCWY